ncbi:TetR/AcrR family transcriptional regulator [Nocardioides panacisoli]|uniref:HTH tetR-type domain-containing protein n=1 Tax=Nocardioides panacisoli TaxID=627624 RepID=A0ABP7ILJ1_9ACTN
MTSAESKWDARRAETTRRLRRCALELTRDQGLDGWTMDDLADAAEVSRRTVFNYFDSKVAVVLGPDHEIGPELRETFVAGGPTGSLVADIVQVAAALMQDETADIDLVQLGRSVVLGDPQLLGIVHQRFEAKMLESTELVLAREGEQYGAERAALLIRLIATIFDSALLRLDPDDPRSLADSLDEAVADAVAVLTD